MEVKTYYIYLKFWYQICFPQYSKSLNFESIILGLFPICNQIILIMIFKLYNYNFGCLNYLRSYNLIIYLLLPSFADYLFNYTNLHYTIIYGGAFEMHIIIQFFLHTAIIELMRHISLYFILNFTFTNYTTIIIHRL